MEKWILPDGWEWATVRKVVKDTSTRNPSQFPDQQFYYIDISSIDNGKGTIKPVNQILGKDAPSRARKVVRKDDVLFATTRPYLKNIALVPEDYDNQICSTGFCVLRANEDLIVPAYLYYLCRSSVIVDQLEPKMRGASYPAVSDNDVMQVEIPLPLVGIQEKIIRRIEAIFSELSEARRLHEKIAADTNRLMDAALAEIFPNPENILKEGWILRSVEELSNDPQYGYTASANKQSDGVKFLRITDIQNGTVDWLKVPSCDCTKREVDQYGLRDGDIVFARTGATTGKTFLVRQPPEAIFASYLIRLQITRFASPDFVYWYFQSPYYWQQIIPRGGAQPNMNAQLLKKVRIPVPESFALQDQIVERILSVKNEIDGMQEQSRETGVLISNLENSILAQAFRGEL